MKMMMKKRLLRKLKRRLKVFVSFLKKYSMIRLRRLSFPTVLLILPVA